MPADHPTDVVYFTRFNAWELARIRMPSEVENRRAVGASAATDQVLEPLLRANQMYVETFLLEHARTRPNITLRFGWQVGAYKADAQGVSAEALSLENGERESWRGQYLIGCDGARSFVRRMLGASYRGFEALQQVYMGGRMVASHVRLPTLQRDFIRGRRGWQYWSMTAERQMMLGALNGDDEFILFSQLEKPHQAPEDAEIARIITRSVGTDLPLEIIGHRTWTGGLALVSERFGDGRVWLAGDSAHLFTPSGGFGLNTGIDDVANLSWKLAAMLQGWGGPSLIASYEIERKPIAARNTAAARDLALRMPTIPLVPEMEEASPVGEAARRKAGAHLASFVESYASIGVQLGVRYDGSPIVIGDESPPADDYVRYTPSGVPGGRAPHAWLDQGRGRGSSLYDRLGRGFTLLRLGRAAVDSSGLEAAARTCGVPLSVLDISDDAVRDLYGRDLALVRPDQHLAWRGNAVPDDTAGLWHRIVGG
jgi:2-polyprenyl-6-methoxyphenol hydroxylase-like FAD-dependent oxidoreductase